MQEFNDNLPLDEAGDLILPVNGELGYWWREEDYNAVLETINGYLDRASLAMVRYKKSCTMVVAARIQNEATCGFLQGSPWEEHLLRVIEAEVEQVEAGGGRDDKVRDEQVIPEPPLAAPQLLLP